MEDGKGKEDVKGSRGKMERGIEWLKKGKRRYRGIERGRRWRVGHVRGTVERGKEK